MIVLNPILTLLHFKDLAPVQLLLHVVKGIRSPCQPHAQHPESPEHMILMLGDATGALASYAPGIQVLCMWLTGHPDSLDYMVANVGHAVESVLSSSKGRSLSLAIFYCFQFIFAVRCWFVRSLNFLLQFPFMLCSGSLAVCLQDVC